MTGGPPGRTLYARLLRLRRTRLHWLLRALYLEGALVVGAVLYLADAASAWVILALPVAVAVAVKIYDAVSDAVATDSSVSDAVATDNQ